MTQKKINRVFKNAFPGFSSKRILLCNPYLDENELRLFCNGGREIFVITDNYGCFQKLSAFSDEKYIIPFNDFLRQIDGIEFSKNIKITNANIEEKEYKPGEKKLLKRVILGLPVSSLGKFDEIFYFCFKSKPANSLWLHLLIKNCSSNASVYILGHNNAGGKSFDKLAKLYFNSVIKYASIAHYVLWKLQSPIKGKKLTYNDVFIDYTCQIRGHDIKIRNMHGVFSEKKLDEGSKVLINSLLAKIQIVQRTYGFLDVGCGAGVLSLSLLKNYNLEEKVYLTDISYSALLSSALNLVSEGFHNFEIIPSDSAEGLKCKVDLIISNPPFHREKQQDRTIFIDIVKNIYPLLNKNGIFICVANSFLKYRPVLNKYFSEVAILKEISSYNVYLAKK